MVFVHYPAVSAPELPFGGYKRSEYGTKFPSLGLEEVVNYKLILIPNPA
jgi:succinate-semialdehyde dehydrogenase/glutarate-semialdehyde dehydrogenase